MECGMCMQLNTEGKGITFGYYVIRHGMDEHNIPNANKQQMNNTPNSLDVYRVLEALKQMIYKLCITQHETMLIVIRIVLIDLIKITNGCW